VAENLAGFAEPVRDRLRRMSVMHREARELLRNAAAAMTVSANRRRRPIPATLRPGAQVWVKRTHLLTPVERAQLRTDAVAQGRAKLQPPYSGPYTVLAQVGNVAFKLDLPASSKAHPVIHADALKLFTPHDRPGLEPDPVEPLLETDADGQQHELFEIGELLDSRRCGRGRKRTEYLARWKYYLFQESEWVKYDRLGQWWQEHIPPSLLAPTDADKRAATTADT
jgi:hypothetical protein